MRELIELITLALFGACVIAWAAILTESPEANKMLLFLMMAG